MLENNNPGSVQTMKSAERCEPDYERMIVNLKGRLQKSTDFKDAALAYFEGQNARNKMAELIGELVTECAQMERELESLIDDQAKAGA